MTSSAESNVVLSAYNVLRALLVAAVLAIAACSAHPIDAQRGSSGGKVITAAQIFDDILTELRARQQKEPWNPRSGQSNPYRLLDVKVEDWYATEEGRFAHSIKIPNPVPEDSGYRPGMTQREYFEHLCRNEAGEFIFKTADNVDGVFQLRPRKVYSEAEWQHLYAMEDPYGYYVGENEDLGQHYVSPLLYSYFEIPVHGRRIHGAGMRAVLHPSVSADPPAGSSIARYYGYDNWNAPTNPLKLEYSTKRKARYGFTWRGIKRPHDRELGIAGGELIVLDLDTTEILGLRRGYAIWNNGWTYRVCPRYGYNGGEDKGAFFTAWFLVKVARPRRWVEFLAEEEKYRIRPK
jgi:hypothetical protein